MALIPAGHPFARAPTAGVSQPPEMPLLPSAARGTMAVLRPAAYHLSPAVGLAVGAGGAHLLPNLYSPHPMYVH